MSADEFSDILLSAADKCAEPELLRAIAVVIRECCQQVDLNLLAGGTLALVARLSALCDARTREMLNRAVAREIWNKKRGES